MNDIRRRGRAGLRRYLIAGVLVWLPVLATVWVLGFIIDLMDRTLWLLPDAVRPKQLFGFDIPGLGIVFAFLVLFFTGLAVTNLLGRQLVGWWEDLMQRIDPFDRNNGTLFQPEWVGDFEARYDWREWTFRYGLTFVGEQDSYEFFGEDPATSPFVLAVSEYITHGASVRYISKNKWEVSAGVSNITDEEPKKFSSGVSNLRVGDGLLYSGYDFFGRTAFLNVSKTF